MLVKFTEDHEVRINKTMTRVYHAGWQGEVDDAIAADAVKKKRAIDLTKPVKAEKPAKDDAGKKDDDGKK